MSDLLLRCKERLRALELELKTALESNDGMQKLLKRAMKFNDQLEQKMNKLSAKIAKHNELAQHKLKKQADHIKDINQENRQLKQTIRSLRASQPDTSARLPRNLFHETRNEYNFEITNSYDNSRFNSHFREYQFTEDIDDFERRDANDFMASILARNLVPDNRYTLTISNDTREFSSDIQHFTTQDEFVREEQEMLIFYELGSANVIPNPRNLRYALTWFDIPTGRGRLQIMDPHRKRSIITLKSNSVCLAKSIICYLSIFNIDKLRALFYNKLTQDEIDTINSKRSTKTNINEGEFTTLELTYLRKESDKKLLETLAFSLHRITEIPIKETGCDLLDVKTFGEKLDIQIFVYGKDKEILYKSPKKGFKINLLLDNNHFDVITNVTAMQCVSPEGERCKYCKQLVIHRDKDPRNCQVCSKYFYNRECYEAHIVYNKCIGYSWKCTKCLRIYKTPVKSTTKESDRYRIKEKHCCYEIYCTNCKEFYVASKELHTCYIKAEERKEPTTNYLFLDFESRLDSENKHIMNYCVIIDYSNIETVFYETGIDLPNPVLTRNSRVIECPFGLLVEKVCKYLLDKYKGYTVFAHYGGGYDFQPIFEWFVNNGLKVKPCMNGNKIIFMEVKFGYNILFLDSKSLINHPLKKFPEIFDFENSFAKGCFPYLFNKPENYKYKGEIPDKLYYDYYNKTSEGKQDLLNELAQNTFTDDVKRYYQLSHFSQDYPFVFGDRIYFYCKLDVVILRLGCLKFRELVLKVSNIDPLQYPTLSSLCHADFRLNHLIANTIISDQTTPVDNHSLKSIKWFIYLSDMQEKDCETKSPRFIQHAKNKGEYYIHSLKRKVDGYCAVTNTVYQFHGCYFHGCLDCFDANTVNKFSGRTMRELNRNTLKFDNQIRDEKYNLVVIWEHEFDNLVKKQNLVFDDDKLKERPKLREAYHGARTETFHLYHEFKDKGLLKDFVSLYPSVMYFEDYGVGQPEIIFHPKNWSFSWFGFAYIKIRPPRNLYLPVLPLKVKDKLLFGLCKTCMELRTKSTCKHTNTDRDLTGFWFTAEINLAVSEGYEIIYIYEVHHFKEKSNNLFKSYIAKWLKIKLESSPVESTKVEKYKADAKTIGITLDEIKPNAGLRNIAKLFLNAFYGRFAMHLNYSQKKYLRSPDELYAILLDKKLDSLDVKFPNNNLAYVSYKLKDENVRNNYVTNLYVGMMTASYARIKLYGVLDKLGKFVSYCDTDSILYNSNSFTEKAIKDFVGNSLGKLEDDKMFEGGHCLIFASIAPKQFSVKYVDSKGIVKEKGKQKGFMFNSDTENKFTLQNTINLIKAFVNDGEDEELLEYNKIKSTRFKIKHMNIQTVEEVKQLVCNFDKRQIAITSSNSVESLPYGFIS